MPAISCYIAFTKREDVALPYDAPVAIEEMAKKHGCRVRRYLRCPTDGADEEARRLAMAQPWVRDGLMTAVRVLDFLKRQHVTLAELTAELPSFAVATKTVPCDVNPGRVLRRMAEKGEGEGIGEGTRIRTANGILLIRPSKLGKSLVLTAEAADTEIAAELCGELEQKLGAVFLDMGEEKQ